MEAQFAILKGFSQVSQKQPPEPAAQHLHGKKERFLPALDPACAVRPDAAARHHTVEMWMKVEILTPGVKDRKKADRRARAFGIGGDCEQGFRCRAEQDAI